MPKQIPTGELDAIAEVVAGHSGGVGVEGIREKLSFSLPARTLQRRLNQLERDGRVRSTGSGKGTRYFPATPAGGGAVVKPAPVGVIKVSTRDGDWLGPEAKEIRRLVTLPPSKRRPVGYDTSFLTSYQPNVTYYLPLAVRERLTEMGQVGITDLPAGTYLRQILDRLLIDLAWNSSDISVWGR